MHKLQKIDDEKQHVSVRIKRERQTDKTHSQINKHTKEV